MVKTLIISLVLFYLSYPSYLSEIPLYQYLITGRMPDGLDGYPGSQLATDRPVPTYLSS